MENNNRASGLKKITLLDVDMVNLISVSGLKLESSSPLAVINKNAGSADPRRAQQSGLIDTNNRLTADGLTVLGVLARPDMEMSLIWGTADSLSTSKVYFSATSDKLVSFTHTNGSSNLSYFLSPQDITDLVTEKTAFPPIKDNVDYSLETGPASLPAFLAVLDLYREAQLKAALERRQDADPVITAAELNRVWQQSKMETNFSWYAPAGYITFAEGPSAQANFEEGFRSLKRQSLIRADGGLSQPGSAFAAAAFPLLSFMGMKAVSRQNSGVEKVHLALFRSMATLLLVQIAADSGKETLYIKSLNTSELPEVLFNLVTRPFDVVPQAVTPVAAKAGSAGQTVICTKCQTVNAAGTRFCSRCGATLTAAPAVKFCPKCGDPVTGSEKFCDKCGNQLV
jgi:hypothetical protein